jgi:hypothetical protein
LIVCKVSWIRTERKEGYKTIFFYNRDLALPTIQKWQSPAPFTVDARELFAAEKLFNSTVHDNY